ncbi:MAG: PQQ-binding-like beta-propeller repeat protein [Candidatus Omnitrophica bacterium]|nr:PQQ-binding-like beta-propeller repeat protein [Candidatus Omnitrophota bacterium]
MILDKTRLDVNVQPLSKAIEQIIRGKEREDLYVLKYDCLIRNKPQQLDLPSYNGSLQGLTISAIKPYAENLYLGNLNLKYDINNLLLDRGDNLWSRETALKNKNTPLKNYYLPLSRIIDFPVDKLMGQKMFLWSYDLKRNNFIPFFILRQWIKEYEEDPVLPIIYQNTVIIRNEFRIFCLDSASGNELWSFGNVDNSFRENYLTAFAPHCNFHGYRITLAGNIVYADLSGNLVALDLTNILKPTLLWKRPLGEYTLCTSPVVINDKIVTGLVNSRGELWISGFGLKTGELAWSTYIGVSSYQSPSNPVSLIVDDKLFISTNYGVLVCLRPLKGELLWIKKYTPKKSFIFDFFRDWKKYKYSRIDPLMSYDTQFLEAGSDRTIYYKPRDSDFLYILDQNNGVTKDRILTNSSKYYFLGACKGNIVFLENNNDSKANIWARVISLKSSKQVYGFNIEGGLLKGVIYGDDGLVFKVGSSIYYLEISDKIITHKKIIDLDDGWLAGFNGQSIFTVRNNTLSCWFAIDKAINLHENNKISAYRSRAEKIKSDFLAALSSNNNGKNELKAKQQLLFDMQKLQVPLKELFPIIEENLGKLKDPSWSDIIRWFRRTYGDEVVSYRDVELKFANFVYGKGLLQQDQMQGKDPPALGVKYSGKIKEGIIRGESLFLVLLMNPAREGRLPDFYLLIKNDQLICVQENGDIRWVRRVCWGCSGNDIHDRFGSVFPVQVYLYDKILIINDFSSIIAVNVNDGSYVWSMMNLSAKTFTNFIGPDLAVINGNKAYSINPATGICRKRRQLDVGVIENIYFSNELIYIQPFDLRAIKVINSDFELVYELPLNFPIQRSKDTETSFLLMKDYFVLNIKPRVYVIDKKNGRLKYKLDLSKDPWYSIDSGIDNLLLVFPFKKINIYRIKGGSFNKLNLPFDGSDTGIVSAKVTQKSQNFYFFDGNTVLFLFHRGDQYFLAAIDVKSGRRLWEDSLRGVRGFIIVTSFMRDSVGQVYFTISTFDCPDEEERKVVSGETRGPADTKLFRCDMDKGRCVEVTTFPSVIYDGLRILTIMETKGCFVYGLYGNIIKVVPKNEITN